MQISQIQCPEPDGQNGWYVTAPEIRIVHKEPGTVTRYRLAGTSGETVLEGELKLEEEEADRNPETEQKEEQREAPASVSDGSADTDGPAAVKEISPELLEEGRNFLEIRMISERMAGNCSVWKKKSFWISALRRCRIYISRSIRTARHVFSFRDRGRDPVRGCCIGVEAFTAVLDGGEEQKMMGSRGSIEVSPGIRERYLPGRWTVQQKKQGRNITDCSVRGQSSRYKGCACRADLESGGRKAQKLKYMWKTQKRPMALLPGSVLLPAMQALTLLRKRSGIARKDSSVRNTTLYGEPGFFRRQCSARYCSCIGSFRKYRGSDRENIYRCTATVH